MKRTRFHKRTAAACALALLLSLCPTARAASGFRDVPANHWAYQAIVDAADSGLTGGYDDGTFRPGSEVTYAQFTAFLARAFYGSPTQSASSPWYQTYLDAVRKDGLLEGTAAANQSAAGLSKSITRYDMALMLYRVLAARGALPKEDLLKTAGQSLSDWSAIPEAYRGAVAACVASGTLNGMSDGSFSGGKLMNRAQACAVISRLRQSLGEPAPAPAPQASLPELRAGLLKLINGERTKSGAKAVESSDKLDSAAQTLIGEIIQGYYDNRPDGRSWATAIVDSGFPFPVSEETEAVQLPVQGCATPEAALAYIKNSPEALKQLLKGGYTHVGVGYIQKEGDFRDCWTVLLVKTPQAAAPSSQTTPEALCAELTRLVNAQRAKAGLKALGSMDSLTQAAQLRAKDLSGGYIETRPDGGDWSTALERTGVQAEFVDESFVVGYRNATDALSIILNTDSAREAMTNGSYTHLGVGYVHTPNGYGGYQDFWSLLYIQASGSGSGSSGGASTGSLSYQPVPMKDLANRKSLQKKASDEQLAQAYAEAAKLVEPFAKLPLEQQLEGICDAVRQRFDSGMSYTMESDHYNDPYGYFIQGAASCAGCTRATGLCLNILGIPYEHVNENQYTHQWCRVKVGGSYWICDPYGLYCGPEPAPYRHANPLLG